MAGPDSSRKAKDMGSESPASEEAKQQGMSGDRGHEAGRTDGSGGQPAQTSNRRGARHREEPEVRKHFAEGQAPSEQGDKSHPHPEQIAKHQQGLSRQSGNFAGRGDRSEEEAQRGEPGREHTRHGRQSESGHRPDHR